jgi:formylglycine-generating enzyme required for sulfatase activity
MDQRSPDWRADARPDQRLPDQPPLVPDKAFVPDKPPLVPDNPPLVPDKPPLVPDKPPLVPDQRPPDKPPLPPDQPTPDKPAPPVDGGVVPGTWVKIVSGTFAMGSPSTEPCRGSDEELHTVTLSQSFEVQTTEVTQGQFQQVLGYSRAAFTSCGLSCPAETLTWHEAAAYCNALSAKKGLTPCYTCTGSGASISCSQGAAFAGAAFYTCPGYRLPTEAEWEYAYRATTTTGYYGGPVTLASCGCSPLDPSLDPIGWYCGNSGNTTHPVAQKQANLWGLYDMAGNVFEWINDLYTSSLGTSPVTNPWGGTSGSNRVWKGGAWCFNATFARAAYRDKSPQGASSNQIGFRCVRTVP